MCQGLEGSLFSLVIYYHSKTAASQDQSSVECVASSNTASCIMLQQNMVLYFASIKLTAIAVCSCILHTGLQEGYDCT